MADLNYLEWDQTNSDFYQARPTSLIDWVTKPCPLTSSAESQKDFIEAEAKGELTLS